ncbi:MAG: hypothetical protein J5934_05015 [Succinivibrio sp.]|nr:hypothetical protein [Succinivibrio sp.]
MSELDKIIKRIVQNENDLSAALSDDDIDQAQMYGNLSTELLQKLMNVKVAPEETEKFKSFLSDYVVRLKELIEELEHRKKDLRAEILKVTRGRSMQKGYGNVKNGNGVIGAYNAARYKN